MIKSDGQYSLQDSTRTDRSQPPSTSHIFNPRSCSHKLFHSSSKTSKERLENSNSQKRRVTDQDRLMKIKKFPSCFLQDKTPHKNYYMKRNDKKSYSVDRVESRRQRRVFTGNKATIQPNIQKISEFPKRSMSEGRKEKKALARNRSQRQTPLVHAMNNGISSCIQNPTLREMGVLKDSIFHTKNSSLKSVKSNLNFVENNSICTPNQIPFEINSSITSVRLQTVEKEGEETSFFQGKEVWPRKFSHINKLAKGLAVNMAEDIPFQLAAGGEMPQRPSANYNLKSLKLRNNHSNIPKENNLYNKGLFRSKSELSQNFMNKASYVPLCAPKEGGVKARLNFKKNKENLEESKQKLKLNPEDITKKKINRQLVQFNKDRFKNSLKPKKKRIKSAKRPRLIIDAASISRPGSSDKNYNHPRQSSQGDQDQAKGDVQKPKFGRNLTNKDQPGLAIGRTKKKGMPKNMKKNKKNDSNIKRLRLMKKSESQNISNLDNYLNRIEITEEPKSMMENVEDNSVSQGSKRSIFINQNHYLHNLHLLPQRNETIKAKTEQQLHEEFMALQKCVDHIPDQEELSLEFECENSTKRLHNLSSAGAKEQCSLDIKEDTSCLVTERTSEVTTEHCSDMKNHRGLKHEENSRSNSQLVQYKMPALSLKGNKNVRNHENPFKQKQSTDDSSGLEQSHSQEGSKVMASGPMNITFGK
ncbi:unnamed protein product [Moneuplotes crassus]|uniref:Uncharacterized protein n=1 Tax=Euplotes crassus TaxID=5936 RepID=A0AAD1YCQ9_EUPCR|nr:unnamed protein product [Moneuplotes crassus]